LYPGCISRNETHARTGGIIDITSSHVSSIETVSYLIFMTTYLGMARSTLCEKRIVDYFCDSLITCEQVIFYTSYFIMVIKQKSDLYVDVHVIV